MRRKTLWTKADEFAADNAAEMKRIRARYPTEARSDHEYLRHAFIKGYRRAQQDARRRARMGETDG